MKQTNLKPKVLGVQHISDLRENRRLIGALNLEDKEMPIFREQNAWSELPRHSHPLMRAKGVTVSHNPKKGHYKVTITLLENETPATLYRRYEKAENYIIEHI